jgi:hypothetical protein
MGEGERKKEKGERRKEKGKRKKGTQKDYWGEGCYGDSRDGQASSVGDI